MSCNDTNPCYDCGQDPCLDTNPCYENCGCLNPTTFECVNKPGAHAFLGVTDGMNGKEVLAKINDVIGDLRSDVDGITTPTANTGDIRVKVSANDAATGYLGDKIVDGLAIKKVVLNPGGNEQLRLNVVIADLISSDSGNQIVLGADKKLKILLPTGQATHFVDGQGTKVAGSGSTSDPYSINVQGIVQSARTCFDGKWVAVAVDTNTPSNVTYTTGQPRMRIRFDGTIELKGNVTYTVNFSENINSGRRALVKVGSISSSCLTAAELTGLADLKSIHYIDAPSGTVTNEYGYIVRKNGTDLYIEFQSSFVQATSKTITVNFDGVTIHPNI